MHAICLPPARIGVRAPLSCLLRRARCGAVAIALAFTAQVAPMAAGGASAFIDDLARRTMTVLSDQTLGEEERTASLAELFVGAFDVPEMARFAAGKHWQSMSEAQRSGYVDLFRQHFVEIVARRFADYSGETIRLLDERIVGADDAAVRAEISRRQGTPIPLEIRLRANGDDYRILDVSIDGQSLLIAKRAEFASVISRDGVDGFLQMLGNQLGA